MTNASIKNVFAALSVFAVSIALSMGVFAMVAHAQSDGTDGGYIYTAGDPGGYVYDSGDNGGYIYTAGDPGGYVYDSGDNGGYIYTAGDPGGYVYDSGNNGGYVYTGCDSYCGSDVWDVYDVYDVGYSYADYGYDYGYGGGYGYSMPSFSFSAPSSYYSNPVVYSAPQQQQQQQQQQRGSSGPITIVNTNTNTNTNVNTGTPSVSTVTPIVTPSYQVQYVYPSYSYPYYYNYGYNYPYYYNYPTYQNVYCTITASQSAVISGQGVYLTWSAPGATSAYLSGVGSVPANGSRFVYPYGATTYTLTVYGGGYGYNYGGYGGSNSCSVTVSTYYTGTSVSLTQIPYTGFDLGLVGNTLYWLALLAFAASAAYLVVYYVPALNLMAKGHGIALTAPMKLVEATAQKIEAAVVEPVRASLEHLPVFEKKGTTDAMSIVRSKKEGEMPRIIITRN